MRLQVLRVFRQEATGVRAPVVQVTLSDGWTARRICQLLYPFSMTVTLKYSKSSFRLITQNSGVVCKGLENGLLVGIVVM